MQGKPIDTQGMSPQQVEAFKKQRQLGKELQLELVALSSNAKYVVADRSGHAIHVDQPELLVQSIGEIVVVCAMRRQPVQTASREPCIANARGSWCG